MQISQPREEGLAELQGLWEVGRWAEAQNAGLR
jgi:hypothetical protein